MPPVFVHEETVPVVFVQVVLVPVETVPVFVVQVVVSPVKEVHVVEFPVPVDVLPVPSAFVLNIISPKLAKTTSPKTFFCSIIFVYIIKFILL